MIQIINRLYGIDYNKYACGGIGNQKLKIIGDETILFYSEKEMLKVLGELKEDYTVGEINVFTTQINREEYKL